MKHFILAGVMAALFFPLAARPGDLTYYDCMNPDGTMSYRVIPCSKGQQEIRKRNDLKDESGGDASAPRPEEQAVVVTGQAEAERQDFKAAENYFRLDQYGEAEKLYRKLAEHGHAPAQFRMGVLYDVGLGVAQDYGQALEWYGKAAEQGDAKAQNNLGFMYSQGKGVARDDVKAHMWFNIAGAHGYEEGRKNRDVVAGRMTPEQVTEAQRQAREWMQAHP